MLIFRERMLQTKGTVSSVSGLFEVYQESSWKQSERKDNRRRSWERKRERSWEAVVGYYKDFSFYSE